MPNVLIRDLPDDVHARLREQAVAEGMSLQAYLVRALDALAGRMSPREWRVYVDERLGELSGPDPARESTLHALDEIRGERESRFDRFPSEPDR